MSDQYQYQPLQNQNQNQQQQQQQQQLQSMQPYTQQQNQQYANQPQAFQTDQIYSNQPYPQGAQRTLILDQNQPQGYQPSKLVIVLLASAAIISLAIGITLMVLD